MVTILSEVGDTVVEGNDNPPTTKRKRACRAQYFCSGVFNYSLDEMKIHFQDHVEKAIFAKEVCPKTGRDHLQCYFDFGKRIIPTEKFPDLKIHWIKCRGNEEQNEKYCMKEGNQVLRIGKFDSDFKIRRSDLRPSQVRIVDELLEPVDPKFNRELKWYWENEGGYGKTITYTYLIDNHKCVMTGGAEADMLRAVTAYIEKEGYPEIIIVNQTYAKDLISYNGLESLLDGCFFSSKYESTMVRFPRCRIAVFANHPPDADKLGANRFDVQELSHYTKCVLDEGM
jgi:hypothetical protein